ncbi:MAG TPA: glycoside hydrolase family 15 protein, partial [Acidimicrobiia bacterium]|nr:glycoside hydrolase family 15 protein [Acidimicrobiia bacterium]
MTTTRDKPSPLNRSDLIEHSIKLILKSQAASGAYPASPNYSIYQYGWLRDGAFIAYAMDLVGHHDSAHRSHQWAADAIRRHQHKVDRLEILDLDKTQPLSNESALHTRFTLDGQEAHGDWGSFQLDGYGFWLSSLAQHVATHDNCSEAFQQATETAVRYLTLTWDLPCYDCWEEYPTRRHSTSWASIAGGLQNVANKLGHSAAGDTAQVITERLRSASTDDIMRKFVDNDMHPARADRSQTSKPSAVAGHERVGKPLSPEAVDASILLTLGNFGPFESDDPLVIATLKEVDSQLVIDGGVHRYRDDEFYGGGQWPVLAGAYAALPQVDPLARQEAIHWIESQADQNGSIPEQVPQNLRNPE